MENAFEEHVCLCALQNQFGFEPKIPLALIDRLGSAAAVFSLDHDSLREIFGPYGKQDLITKQALDDADRILSTLPPDCRFIGFGESGYPALLADCPDPPAGLYYRSTSPPEMVFRDLEAIAVVGTRNCSSYGYDMCDKVVRALAGSSRSPLIVSGLALGIDGIAHRAALEAGGTTVGVMATGIESVYPSRHEELAQRIVQTPGCALVTDYPPGTQPLAIHFLRRNRIIAGLSRATILAESRIRGGGMMTARLAASYDREVFAIPGNIDCAQSQGCNLLIREKLAEPITDIGEFVLSLGYAPPRLQTARDVEEAVREAFRKELPQEQVEELARAAALVKRRRDITAEELARAAGTDYARAAALLGRLEAAGFARADLLGRYRIVRQ